jgi:hypothetical protein
MSDASPLPVEEGRDEAVIPPEPIPPSPEDYVRTHYDAVRDGGLVFDAFHALFTRHLSHPNPAVREMRARNLDVLEHSHVVVVASAHIDQLAHATSGCLYDRLERPSWGQFLPLWLEWDGLALDHPNIQAGDSPIVALWIVVEVGNFPEAPDAVNLRVNLMRLDMTFDAMIYVPNGSWAYEQKGPCLRMGDCVIAARVAHTIRTQPQHNGLYYVREFADQRAALEFGCACHLRGKWFSQFLSLLSADLLARSDDLTSVPRGKPLPSREGMSGFAWSLKRDAIATWNHAHPSYRRLSAPRRQEEVPAT